MRDDLLVAVAKRQPVSRRDLEALRDFSRPGLLQKSQAILAVVERARATPVDSLPEHAPRRTTAPAHRRSPTSCPPLWPSCAQRKVAASLAANVSDLKHLIRWYLDDRPDRDRPALLSGWRGELCGELFLEVLEGQRTFRVVDPASELPIALEPARPDRGQSTGRS